MRWLIAFAALFATDVAWAVYVDKVKEGNALHSAAWAIALFVLGAVAVIGYTTDPWLLAPSAAGAFCGTFAGVWWNGRRAKPKTRVSTATVHAANERARTRSHAHGLVKPGWYCSLEKGHDGPCAAWPVSHATAATRG